jgi:hypothetical protein
VPKNEKSLVYLVALELPTLVFLLCDHATLENFVISGFLRSLSKIGFLSSFEQRGFDEFCERDGIVFV